METDQETDMETVSDRSGSPRPVHQRKSLDEDTSHEQPCLVDPAPATIISASRDDTCSISKRSLSGTALPSSPDGHGRTEAIPIGVQVCGRRSPARQARSRWSVRAWFRVVDGGARQKIYSPDYIVVYRSLKQ